MRLMTTATTAVKARAARGKAKTKPPETPKSPRKLLPDLGVARGELEGHAHLRASKHFSGAKPPRDPIQRLPNADHDDLHGFARDLGKRFIGG